MDTLHQVLHALTHTTDVGPSTVQHLFSAYLNQNDLAQPLYAPFAWQQLYEQREALKNFTLSSDFTFYTRLGFSAKVSTLLAAFNDSGVQQQEDLHLVKQRGVQLISIFDEAYPSLLRHIAHPPLLLYVQGDLGVLHKNAVAFVGSRMANRYGNYVTDTLVQPLAAAGIVIVSGGALGADAMAHQAALNAGGKTVAVLGSGLCHLHPKTNGKIFDALLASGGALVSQFPMNTKADKYTFPARNRVIAGLAQATVVVQAAEKSGALITAHYALESGRDVFAVPGPIDDPLSKGCHALLAQGGLFATKHTDIISGHLEAQMSSEQLIKIPRKPQDELLDHLDTPVTLDELVVSTGLDFEVLQNKLFTLQLNGAVRQDFTGSWQRV